MIKKILDFFELNLSPHEKDTDDEQQLKLASAALLVEMIRMDHQIDQAEQATVLQLLQDTYQISPAEAANLFELADEESQNAVDYYRFAQLINTHYSQAQKIQIIENLWQVAYADGVIDKYEEHYLRKVTDLLHVPHKEFIKAKHRIIPHD